MRVLSLATTLPAGRRWGAVSPADVAHKNASSVLICEDWAAVPPLKREGMSKRNNRKHTSGKPSEARTEQPGRDGLHVHGRRKKQKLRDNGELPCSTGQQVAGGDSSGPLMSGRGLPTGPAPHRRQQQQQISRQDPQPQQHQQMPGSPNNKGRKGGLAWFAQPIMPARVLEPMRARL